MSIFKTRDRHARLAPPAQGTDARLRGVMAGRRQGPPGARQLGHPPGGADVLAGLRGGPEQSRRILAFQTLKEQFSIPMNFQNLPKPLLGGGHALFCTFSFRGGVVVGGGRGGPPLCEKDSRGHGLGCTASLSPRKGASRCVLMVGQAAAVRLRQGLGRAALL